MEGNTAIAKARNPKTPAVELFLLVGTDAAIDVALASNPASPTGLLERLSRSSLAPVRRKVVANPSTPKEVLVRLASEFPASLFKNPALPDLLVKNKKFPLELERKALLKMLVHQNCPQSIRDWTLKNGTAEHQVQYLFMNRRSDAVDHLFLNSRHPIIVLAVLEKNDAAYILWASELGFKSNLIDGNEYLDRENRREIDHWLTDISGRTSNLWDQLVPKSGSAESLQGELVRASGRITGDYYKNDMMNWDGWFESLLKQIQETLKSDPGFSRLAKKVIDADVAQIKACGRQGQDMGAGKEPRTSVFDSGILKGDVEESFIRLDAMIVLWCARHPDPIPYDDPDAT